MPWAEQKDAQNVVAEINKKLENLLPNTQIALTLDSGMADKWSLWMSTQREIDIAHSGYATNIEDEVRNESYLELNDLVEEYLKFYEKLDLLKSVNGLQDIEDVFLDISHLLKGE